MTPFEYHALKLVQQPGAPPFYITAAPADELLAWCDVPRAKVDYMAGYQRALEEKRVNELADYLRLSPNNIIPGAVIVAADSDYVTITELGNDVYSVVIAEDTRDFKTKLQELWGMFSTRLANEELESAGIQFVSVESDEAVDQVGVSSEGDSDGAFVDASTDLAESTEDVELLEELEDDQSDEDDEGTPFPSSYLASLTKELSTAMTDWASLTPDRQKAIESYIAGVSKPGLIIDGQHRVFGAKNVSEHSVHLPVVLLPGLPYSEQVFQFYVLNSKARPLKPTELRRIVSTSLTNAEIDTLYDRFREAGISAEEARWTLQLDTNVLSPFRGRIDFGFKAPGTVIPENVADQVVRAFMKMPSSRYRQLIAPLDSQWTDPDKRLCIFFWFWNAIKEMYSGAWEEAETAAVNGQKHQLFMKVSLLTLQQFVLDRFVTALPYRNPTDAPPLSGQAEVASMVKSTLTNLPEKFFQREWKLKQIDTSEGRRALYGAMDAVWNNQGKLHGNMRLFQG